MKKVLAAVLACMTFSTAAYAYTVPANLSWAKTGVDYCVARGIVNGVGGGDLALEGNLTREQMAKLLVQAFNKQIGTSGWTTFTDVGTSRWSYPYVESFVNYMKVKNAAFNPTEYVTREEFASSLMMILGYNDSSVLNPTILKDNFYDYNEVSPVYNKLMCVAVEKGYMMGSNDRIYPKTLVNRAEACTLLYRAMEAKAGNIKLDLGVRRLYFTLVGEPTVTLEQAKRWAASRGAHQRFIDIADIYWKYGQMTGIRPEILYAQSAKETGFGKYGGAVIPEQNNWAGIKTRNATGDTTYDHESFATPDDGVRAHFNHMCAYIGKTPIGEPHGRYYSVKSISWAGTVKYIEELGGKWCPDLYYGYSIYYNYLKPMQES